MNYEETKNYLLENYEGYFKILDIDSQTRALMFTLDKSKIKEKLDKNVQNYMECQKKIAETKYYSREQCLINTIVYEKALKAYKELYGEDYK